jgi:ribokinase/non-canonical purine NTP pyrophosphatase (RdgB/HAM1 family)
MGGIGSASSETRGSAAECDIPNGKVVIVGSINQDLTTYTSSLPSPGQTILGSDFVAAPGGKGANQAVAATSIGVVDARRGGVHMIGRVGDDDMGIGLIRGLQSRGVKLNDDDVRVVGAHTGVASIYVDTTSGENTIVVAPGANLALGKDDVESSLMEILGRGDEKGCVRDVVLVQLEIAPETALQALLTASKLGALAVLNPAPAPKGWELTEEWYSAIDVLIPNETELGAICGLSNSDDVTGEGEEAMAIALLERGVRLAVIVTLGARGVMIVMRDASENAPSMGSVDGHRTIMISEPPDLPCKSEPVVDTVGAGDAFCGALAAYLSRGITLEKAASMACGVASMSVRKRGAQESYPRAEDLPGCLLIEHAPTDDGIAESKTRTRKTITFVTGNKNKLAEVQRLLFTSSDGQSTIPFDIDNHQLDLPELQGSPRDIAHEKCQMASMQLKTAVLTEDTCLCFRGLNDLPGPYIKWFLDGLGHDGLNKLLQGFDDNRAYAQTIIAFSPGPGKDVLLFEGRTEGRIVPARGSKDFGWDPIFEPTEDEQGCGSVRTYAEMSQDEKNAISHRGRAFHKFREYLLRDSDSIYDMIEDK